MQVKRQILRCKEPPDEIDLCKTQVNYEKMCVNASAYKLR